MKLTEITLKSGGTLLIASMTYDEEHSLAMSVTQALSKPWLSAKYRKLASKLYGVGTNGSSPRAEDLQEYLDIRVDWAENLEEIGRGHDSPPEPVFELDDTIMRAPKTTRAGETSVEWKAQWYADQRRLAWREAWVKNKKALCSYSNDYRVFPGDSNEELENQELSQLQPFFDYVRENRKKYKCSLDQAIREARGHIPHAELSVDDLHELYSEYPAK